jgi:CrcB protein
MRRMLTYALVALGSAIGGTLRYWLAAVVAEATAGTFPWGTLLINVTGSAAIGLFATLSGTDGRIYVPGEWRAFFMVGVCGGYTTFSSFSLQTLTLVQDGEWLAAGMNVLGSVALCLLAVWLGHAAAAALNR